MIKTSKEKDTYNRKNRMSDDPNSFGSGFNSLVQGVASGFNEGNSSINGRAQEKKEQVDFKVWVRVWLECQQKQ